MYNLYSYRKKRSTGKIILILLIVTLTAFSVFFLYEKEKPLANITDTDPLLNAQEKTINATVEKEEIKYNVNSDFNLTVFYSCGHQKSVISKVPPAFYNKTISEIKVENPEYDISGYNDFSITATEITSDYCDNHYIIILNGNKLTSYNKKTPDVTEKEITINLNEFLKSDIEILKNGIEVGSKTELLEYFENFAI